MRNFSECGHLTALGSTVAFRMCRRNTRQAFCYFFVCIDLCVLERISFTMVRRHPVLCFD